MIEVKLNFKIELFNFETKEKKMEKWSNLVNYVFLETRHKNLATVVE